MIERNGREPRILIVDDSVANVRLLTRILQRGGYGSVRGVSDPRLVPGCVEADPPDLVILDIHMPHIDGLSLMQQLAKDLAEVRFIVVTGDLDDTVDRQARSRGADDVIIKPFQIDDVLVRVRLVLGL